jgi:DNA-binding transcriptional MocR family regulator
MQSTNCIGTITSTATMNLDANLPTLNGQSAPLTRDSDLTLTEQLAQRFADRIRQNWLAPGARLPSVRECARTHDVSPYTVVAAYDQLLAQGLIEARSQRGYFVRQAPRPSHAVNEVAGRKPHPFQPSTPIDATTLIRGMFHEPGARPMPGLGTLPPAWLDAGMLGAALRRVTQGDKLIPLSLHYGEPAGDARFRRAMTHRLIECGFKLDADQLITTIGATHALDLVCRTLLQPGDAVLVDEPGWPVEFARLAQLGLRVLPVPRTTEGPDLAVMRKLARDHHPKLYVTVSVLHNPTSTMLSPGHAHQVLRLAETHSFHILEDDIYGFLAPPHATRLSVLDELQRTICVGSFSKILTPSWRVGYIAAPRDLVERITNTKLLTTLTTPPMLEQALALCLEQGQLRRHCDRVIGQLDAARARCIQLARQAGCTFVFEPQGLFGWVDTGMDTERLTIPMLDAGWLIAPGALFHAQRRPSTLMRINFASSQDAKFWKALQAARKRRT